MITKMNLFTANKITINLGPERISREAIAL